MKKETDILEKYVPFIVISGLLIFAIFWIVINYGNIIRGEPFMLEAEVKNPFITYDTVSRTPIPDNQVKNDRKSFYVCGEMDANQQEVISHLKIYIDRKVSNELVKEIWLPYQKGEFCQIITPDWKEINGEYKMYLNITRDNEEMLEFEIVNP